MEKPDDTLDQLRALLNRYTQPCASDCEHSQCPLLRELHALHTKRTLERAQLTIRPIVDRERQGESIGDLMGLRLDSTAASSSLPAEPEQPTADQFWSVIEQRDAWIQWGWAMLKKAGVAHYRPDQHGQRALLSRLLIASATQPTDLPFDDYCAGKDCRACAGVNCTCPHHAPNTNPESLYATCRRVWVCKRCGNCLDHCKHKDESNFHEDLGMPCSVKTPPPIPVVARASYKQRAIEKVQEHSWIDGAEGLIERIVEQLQALPDSPIEQRFIDTFRDTAIKCHIGFKHEGPWEKCEWIECEDRRNIIAAATTSSTSETPVGGEAQKRNEDGELTSTCKHCGQPISQTVSTGSWYHDSGWSRMCTRLTAAPVVATGGDQNGRARWLLAQIVRDLPANRDWLDPEIEREARKVAGESK